VTISAALLLEVPRPGSPPWRSYIRFQHNWIVRGWLVAIYNLGTVRHSAFDWMDRGCIMHQYIKFPHTGQCTAECSVPSLIWPIMYLLGYLAKSMLLVLIELFALVLRLRRYERISTENRRFRYNTVSLTTIFRWKGSPPHQPFLLSQN